MPDFPDCNASEAVAALFDYFDAYAVFDAMSEEFRGCSQVYNDEALVFYYTALSDHCVFMRLLAHRINLYKGSHATDSQKANSGS